ncbi:hypothetical protein [Rubripirellula obstinata]|uniref:hypothetical protein n=1 Tax=Rubripirellula obstinata TaxID=406547 RepID=UPI00135C8CF3|nr:hypothetical protein [Rubripirellula obstinata]
MATSATNCSWRFAVAELAKSFDLHCRITESLGDFRYKLFLAVCRSGTRQEFRPPLPDHRKSWRLPLQIVLGGLP